MRKIILILLATSTFAFSCNSHAKTPTKEELTPITTILFEGKQISSLEVNSLFDVEIKYGKETKAELTISKLLEEHLEVLHKGEKLTVSLQNVQLDKYKSRYRDQIIHKLVLTTPNLNELQAFGMCDVKILSKFKCENLKIVALGMSEINGGTFNVSGKATIKSEGMCDITGLEITSAEKVNVKCIGMSDLAATLTNTIAADIECVGMGDMKIQLNNAGTVEVDSDGMSDINLTGSCKSLHKSTAGMSDISSNVDID